MKSIHFMIGLVLILITVSSVFGLQFPFRTIYDSNIYNDRVWWIYDNLTDSLYDDNGFLRLNISSTNLTGKFVEIAGDTMTGNLTVPSVFVEDNLGVGTGASDISGLKIGDDALVFETEYGHDNIRIGWHAATPRIIFENAGFRLWEIDVSSDDLRFFRPGLVIARLTNKSLQVQDPVEFIGFLNWSNLRTYPAACPAYSAITELDDSVTCTSYELMSTLNVTGTTYVGGTLNVTGNISIGDNIYVTGNASIDGTLNVTGDVLIDGVLNITKNATVRGNLSVYDHIYMGNADNTSIIYFWDDISGPGTGPTGEYLMWNDTISNFQFSDSLELVNGHFYAQGFIYSDGDIFTTSTNDDLWLGAGITEQEDSNFKAYANGKLNITGPLENRDWTILGDPIIPSAIVRREGDVFSSERAFFENTITSFAPEYGTGLAVRNYGDEINISSLGMTATLDGNTHVLCDSTNPFVEEHKGMILTVLNSNPGYIDATGEIKSYINSSCISLSFGSADYEEIASATYMTYYVYPHPAFMVLDNGFISSYVGTNPDSRFEIHILNGTGFHGVYIEDVAGADQHQTITTNTDMKGKQGVVGFNSFLYSSTPIGVEEAIKSDNIKLEIDATNINQSRLAFLSTSIIGTPSKNTQIDGIHMDVAVNNIITMGSQDVLAKIYNESTDISNVMTGIPYTILSHDNDVLYLGDTVDFTIITFHFDTPSSGDLLFNYYYCDESHEYVSLGTVLDTTNGFKTSGTISFTNPSDRGDCNKSLDGTPFADMTNYTYIAIERTKNNVVTPPILDDITVSGATPRFILRDDMMKFNPVNTAPETCPLNTRDESMLGAMYFDISEDGTCECRAGGWKVIRDGSICT